MRKFSSRSLSSLSNVHPDLQRVAVLALQQSPIDFTVIEGRRTVERQKELIASGASRTMNSRHIHGLAIDLWPIDPNTGKLANGNDGPRLWELYHKLGPAVKAAATELEVPITWGGDWTTFKDGPHFELPHALYPDRMSFTSLTAQQLGEKPAIPEPEAPTGLTLAGLDIRLELIENQVAEILRRMEV